MSTPEHTHLSLEDAMQQAGLSTEILKVQWPIFKQFQANLPTDHPAAQLVASVTEIIETDEPAAMAIFAAGLVAGLQVMTQALEAAHVMVHVEEAMTHVPEKKRPRA